MEWVGPVLIGGYCVLVVIGSILVALDWMLKNFFNTSIDDWIDKLFGEEG
jgi:hypothetical protein